MNLNDKSLQSIADEAKKIMDETTANLPVVDPNAPIDTSFVDRMMAAGSSTRFVKEAVDTINEDERSAWTPWQKSDQFPAGHETQSTAKNVARHLHKIHNGAPITDKDIDASWSRVNAPKNMSLVNRVANRVLLDRPDNKEIHQHYKDIKEEAERPYVCVHTKKGRHECTAKSSYEAAQKAAAKWGLKNTAGVSAHLADVTHTAVDEAIEDLDESKVDPVKDFGNRPLDTPSMDEQTDHLGAYKAGTKVMVDGKRGEISHVHHSNDSAFPHNYKITDLDANDPYKQKRLEGGNFIPHNRVTPMSEGFKDYIDVKAPVSIEARSAYAHQYAKEYNKHLKSNPLRQAGEKAKHGAYVHVANKFGQETHDKLKQWHDDNASGKNDAMYGKEVKEGWNDHHPRIPAHPLRDHPYHGKSEHELHFIMKDAAEARQNAEDMGNTHGANKYADQVNDAATVLHHRDSISDKSGKLPDWYQNHYKPSKNLEESMSAALKGINKQHDNVLPPEKKKEEKKSLVSKIKGLVKKVIKEETVVEHDEKYAAHMYHGGPWDRGSADAYYGREKSPHKYPQGTYNGDRVKLSDPEELAAYHHGYDHTTDRKNWGEGVESPDLEPITEGKGGFLALVGKVQKDGEKYHVWQKHPAGYHYEIQHIDHTKENGLGRSFHHHDSLHTLKDKGYEFIKEEDNA